MSKSVVEELADRSVSHALIHHALLLALHIQHIKETRSP